MLPGVICRPFKNPSSIFSSLSWYTWHRTRTPIRHDSYLDSAPVLFFLILTTELLVSSLPVRLLRGYIAQKHQWWCHADPGGDVFLLSSRNHTHPRYILHHRSQPDQQQHSLPPLHTTQWTSPGLSHAGSHTFWSGVAGVKDSSRGFLCDLHCIITSYIAQLYAAESRDNDTDTHTHARTQHTAVYLYQHRYPWLWETDQCHWSLRLRKIVTHTVQRWLLHMYTAYRQIKQCVALHSSHRQALLHNNTLIMYLLYLPCYFCMKGTLV